MFCVSVIVGSPGPPSKPTLEQKEKSVILVWMNGDEGETPIKSYVIQVMPKGTHRQTDRQTEYLLESHQIASSLYK